MKARTLLMGILILSVLPACQWVKLKPGSEHVKVVNPINVVNCPRIGWVEVAVRDTYIFNVKRNKNVVGTELATSARNQAAAQGADSIVANTDAVNGKQKFDIYRCQ